LHLAEDLSTLGVDCRDRVAADIGGKETPVRGEGEAKRALTHRHAVAESECFGIEDRNLVGIAIGGCQKAAVGRKGKPCRGTAGRQALPQGKIIGSEHPDARIVPVGDEKPLAGVIDGDADRSPVEPNLRVWGTTVEIEPPQGLAVGAYGEDRFQAVRDGNAGRHSWNGDAPDLLHAIEVDDAQVAGGLVGDISVISERRSRHLGRRDQSEQKNEAICRTSLQGHRDLPCRPP
jgi:hypothetical protein